MKVRICLDEETFVNKPEKKNVSKISKRIAGEACCISEEEIVGRVGKEGCTFCPAVFQHNHRGKSDFREMQLFVLDFDNGFEYHTIRTKCQEYGLPILFSYYTFSSTQEHPKYRVVFCHIVPITVNWLADMMLDMLKGIFQEADSSCFEVTRMFFGGKGIIEYNKESVFFVDRLVYKYQQEFFARDSVNYMRNIKRLADRYGIAIKPGGIMNIYTYKTGEMEEKTSNSIKIIIELDQNSSKIVFYEANEESHNQHQHCTCKERNRIGNITVKRLCETCRLARQFSSGEYTTHAQKFLLATNIIHIKGMTDFFLDTLKAYYGHECYNKWKFDLRYIGAMEYKPESCECNCPYKYECVHDRNICLTVLGRKSIRKSEPLDEYVSLEESYNEMEIALKKALSSNGIGIHLIKGQTGLGKSYAYKNLLRELEKPVIVAVPTVILKNEIAKALCDVAVEVLSLKELCMPSDLESNVQSLYDRGLHKEAKSRICEYANKLENPFEKNRYETFLNYNKIIKKKNSHIIMTHACLLKTPAEQLKGYDIIIDEDILATMLRNICSVSIENVDKAIRAGKIAGPLLDELKEVLRLPDDSYLKSSISDSREYIAEEIQDKLQIDGNVNGLFCSGSYHLCGGRIEYFIPQKLPYQKVIIMSATLNEAVYQLYCEGRKIIVYDTPKAEYKGKLIQYTSHSVSRNSLKELREKLGGIGEVLERIMKLAPGWEYGISFKEYDVLLKSKMHFGNAAGIDGFKGKDGLIIGTPHLNESSYKLIACYLGIPVHGKEAKICRLKIVHHGYEFYMMTYRNIELREIQIYMIHSELEQCIGRSRLLRENATVYLFSNFPCEQAELIQTEYLAVLDEDNKIADVPGTAHRLVG